ncbi:hypothetical protein GCM10011490_06760 [Pseudoclavibacter endophyticus]|uniref:Uncharacterized protein n=1 Tax=Pseudoclavibacter endophyticus TaxID=1778590 RepID=A0A6H9WLX7_9MICO|nr:hypothetical protein [Pseudoclavibacter endophyticus]KAB1649836.1 hypothetical protein F8O04_06300 [Pseudoclavibacter endophyticus]GGA59399.1 hypothetical protein GCM10011490_06760 [Pseudoclavibacter endophyticus]
MTMTITRGAIRQEALEHIESYVDPGPQRDRLKGLAADLTPYGQQLEQTLADARTKLDSAFYGAASIDEVFNAARDLQAAQADAAIWSELRSRVTNERVSARDRRSSFEPEDTTPGLTYLDQQLQALTAHVHDLDATLGTVTSADAALRAGGQQATAWLDLDEALAVYDEIRQAQHDIIGMTTGLPDSFAGREGAYFLYGHMRDPLAHEGEVTARYRRLPTRNIARHRSVEPYFDWLEVGPIASAWKRAPRDTWPTGDRHAYLRWLARENQAWVPTIEQTEQLADLINRMTSNNVHDALDAHDEYFAGRGLPQPVDTDSIRAELPPVARKAALR